MFHSKIYDNTHIVLFIFYFFEIEFERDSAFRPTNVEKNPKNKAQPPCIGQANPYNYLDELCWLRIEKNETIGRPSVDRGDVRAPRLISRGLCSKGLYSEPTKTAQRSYSRDGQNASGSNRGG